MSPQGPVRCPGGAFSYDIVVPTLPCSGRWHLGGAVIQTPDKDWRLALCVGAGIGAAVLLVPRLFGADHFGIWITAILAVLGFFAGLVIYAFFFLERHW